jgi:hypothetical protein
VTTRETIKVDSGRMDFREIKTKGGVSTIQWSVQISNDLKLSREYSVMATFYDKNGKELFTDITKETLAPGEEVTIVRKVDVPTEKASKIMSAKAEGGSL